MLKNESERGSVSVDVQGLLPLKQEKAVTKEYKLFLNEMYLRDSISAVQQLKLEKDTYYDVLSRFPEVGNVESRLRTKNAFTFPLIAFLMLCLVFASIKTLKFIKNYES